LFTAKVGILISERKYCGSVGFLEARLDGKFLKDETMLEEEL
jgi:hypothetical protein